jgi:hypothetical protein
MEPTVLDNLRLAEAARQITEWLKTPVPEHDVALDQVRHLAAELETKP